MNVKKSVFQLAKQPSRILTVYGFPSGTRPTLAILSLVSSSSYRRKDDSKLLLIVRWKILLLTRSENTQLGLAVPRLGFDT
jgi:hypothetical protein